MKAAIGLCGALAATLASCAPAPLVMGVVDPERISTASTTEDAPNCTIHRRASVPLIMAGLPMVTALVNDRPARLILDTGAESSIIGVAAAKRLAVTNDFDFQRSMTGISQTMTTGDARLNSMSLGGATLAYPRALVGPIALNLDGATPDGLLGASQLAEFDLDIDLPHRRLDLYDRTDCPTLSPPWSGTFSTLETTRSLSLHPFFDVTINGRALKASLDTGAQHTLLATSAVEAAGVGRSALVAGSEHGAKGAAGETLPAALFNVSNMRIGAVPVRGPILVTAAKLPLDIDALIGADFLQTHRVWLSYGSRRFFVQ